MNPDNMLELLQRYPPARERKRRSHAIAYLLKNKFKDLADMNIDSLAEAVTYSETLSRQWRQITERNPWLRGNDYHQKSRLVRKKKLDLGYKL